MSKPVAYCKISHAHKCSKWHIGEEIPPGGVIGPSERSPGTKPVCGYGAKCNARSCMRYHPGDTIPYDGIAPPRKFTKSSNTSASSSFTPSSGNYPSKNTPSKPYNDRERGFKDGSKTTWRGNDDGNESLRFSSYSRVPQRFEHPIGKLRKDFCDLLQREDLVIVHSPASWETSTKIPLFAHATTGSRVLLVCPSSPTASCLQSSIPSFDSFLRGVSENDDFKSSDQFETDDSRICTISVADLLILFAEFPLLDKFEVVVVLEAQLQQDWKIETTLALLRDVHRKRNAPVDLNSSSDDPHNANPMKLVLVSSTERTENLQNFFGSSSALLTAYNDEIAIQSRPVLGLDAHGTLIALQDSKGSSQGSKPDEGRLKRGKRAENEEEEEEDGEASIGVDDYSLDNPSKLLTCVLEAVKQTILDFLDQNGSPGNILVLVGPNSLAERLQKQLWKWSEDMRNLAVRLASTSKPQYLKDISAYVPYKPEYRMVVVASEFADMAARIPNVALVIDTGLISKTTAFTNSSSLKSSSSCDRNKLLCNAHSTSGKTYIRIFDPPVEMEKQNSFEILTLSFFLLYMLRAKIPNPRQAIISSPSKDLILEAEALLFELGLVRRKKLSETENGKNLDLMESDGNQSTEITDLGLCLLSFKASVLHWALATVLIAENLKNAEIAAAFYAVTVDGRTIFEMLNAEGDKTPALETSTVFRDYETHSELLAQAALEKKELKSDIFLYLKLFLRWIHASEEVKSELELKYNLERPTMTFKAKFYSRALSLLLGAVSELPNSDQTIGTVPQNDLGDREIEAIGRALAVTFPKLIAQVLIPAAPSSLKVCLLESGTSAKLSIFSALATHQSNNAKTSAVLEIDPAKPRLLVALRLSGWKASMCHPIKLEWLHERHRRLIEPKLQLYVACFSQSNLHHSFKKKLLSSLRTLPREMLGYAYVEYFSESLTLTAYCPKDKKKVFGDLVTEIVAKEIKMLEEYETYEPFGPNRIVTLKSGFVISDLDSSKRNVAITAPNCVDTKEELSDWIKKSAGFSDSDISFCYLATSNLKASDTSTETSGNQDEYETPSTIAAKLILSLEQAPRPSMVSFKSVEAASRFRSFLETSSDLKLEGASISSYARTEQSYPVFVEFKSSPEEARQALMEYFQPQQIASVTVLKKGGICVAMIITSSISQAQKVLDQFPKKSFFQAIVSTPPDAKDVYEETLLEYKNPKELGFRELQFSIEKNSIVVEGSKAVHIYEVAQSLRASLAPTVIQAFGDRSVFYTECHRVQWKPTDAKKAMYKVGFNEFTKLARSLTLYGSLTNQNDLMSQLNEKFSTFKCISIDVTTVRRQFWNSQAGSAQLSKLFKSPKYASAAVAYKVNEQIGVIYIYEPMEYEKETATNWRKLSEEEFSLLVAGVKAIANSFKSPSSIVSIQEQRSNLLCWVCGKSSPEYYLTICGHGYHLSCLCSLVTAGKEVRCYYCDHLVPIREFPDSQTSKLLGQYLRSLLSHYTEIDSDTEGSSLRKSSGLRFKEAPDHLRIGLELAKNAVACPSCSHVAERLNLDAESYQRCKECLRKVCMLCGVSDNILHEGLDCKEFKNKVQSADSATLLETLFKMAESFAGHTRSPKLGETVQTKRNPWLERGSPAMQKFINGLVSKAESSSGSKSSIQLLNNIWFAWHGTSMDSIPSIFENGFDPKKRKAQQRGVGEYFASTPDVSLPYASPRGHSHVLILTCLLEVDESSVNYDYSNHISCFVVNNPKEEKWDRSYCLPLLLVKFSGEAYHEKQVSLDDLLCFNSDKYQHTPFDFKKAANIENSSSSSSSGSMSTTRAVYKYSESTPMTKQWRVLSEEGPWVDYDMETCMYLEYHYQLYLKDTNDEKLRYVELRISTLEDTYLIDFKEPEQVNPKTGNSLVVDRE